MPVRRNGWRVSAALVVGAVVFVVVIAIALVLAQQPIAALILTLCAATVAWAIAQERQDQNSNR